MKRDAAAPGPCPGTYLLRFDLAEPCRLAVGRLGTVELRPGVHYYAGSALGPGGVAARVRRHLVGSRRIHWHIDRLRAQRPVSEVWYCHGPVRLEHAWAAALLVLAAGEVAVPRFGASDCRCPSHLVRFVRAPSPATLRRILGGASRWRPTP